MDFEKCCKYKEGKGSEKWRRNYKKIHQLFGTRIQNDTEISELFPILNLTVSAGANYILNYTILWRRNNDIQLYEFFKVVNSYSLININNCHKVVLNLFFKI
jgi:hypothetical protein